MKNIIYLSIALLFFSCDKRKDIFLLNNQAIGVSIVPLNAHAQISFGTLNDGYRDTMKLGLPLTYTIQLSDEIDIASYKFTGSGVLFMNGQEIQPQTNYSLSTGQTNNLSWETNVLGDHSFVLTFTDSYGVETVKTFYIHVFDNWVPNINWSLNLVGNFTPREYKFNVVGHDKDLLWGGGTVYYEYVINQDTTLFPYNDMSYVFPEAGSYYISVRCKDNDNSWSNLVVNANYIIP
jgi:hypothetical protein